jgi:hypothetical protein
MMFGVNVRWPGMLTECIVDRVARGFNRGWIASRGVNRGRIGSRRPTTAWPINEVRFRPRAVPAQKSAKSDKLFPAYENRRT